MGSFERRKHVQYYFWTVVWYDSYNDSLHKTFVRAVDANEAVVSAVEDVEKLNRKPEEIQVIFVLFGRQDFAFCEWDDRFSFFPPESTTFGKGR